MFFFSLYSIILKLKIKLFRLNKLCSNALFTTKIYIKMLFLISKGKL